MSISPYTAFRMHDVAVSNWCAEIAYVDGRQVPNLVASPLRAFSEYRNLLIDAGQLDASAPISRVPLPFISIERGDMTINPSIMSPRGRFRNMGFTDSSLHYTYTARIFTPIFLPYTISVWSKLIQHQAVIVDSFMRRFYGFYDYGFVKNPPCWDNFYVPLKFNNFTEASVNDGGDDERIIRNILQITAEGRLYHAAEEAATLQNFNATLDLYKGPHETLDHSLEELEPYLETVAVLAIDPDSV